VIPLTKLRSLVLQQQDVGRGFIQYEFRPQDPFDYRAGPLDTASGTGREAGWVTRYRQPPTSRARGPLLIVSVADVFRTEEGAERGLNAYRNDFRGRTGESSASLIRVPKIGEDQVGLTLRQGAGLTPIRYYRIAWRDRNVVAFISVSGKEGNLTLPEAARLARLQQRRIAYAGG
jgi:hypothetical protein